MYGFVKRGLRVRQCIAYCNHSFHLTILLFDIFGMRQQAGTFDLLNRSPFRVHTCMLDLGEHCTYAVYQINMLACGPAACPSQVRLMRALPGVGSTVGQLHGCPHTPKAPACERATALSAARRMTARS